VFLDPPYTEKAGRKNSLYAKDDLSVGHAVCEWALEWGNDERMRIALCGYEGEYEMPDDWECVAWKTQGGYGNEGKGNTAGRENAKKERIWFSPHCIAARRLEQGVLF
jgi:DNA adenine methylase